MNILVTGGAGYIGSHTIVELLNNGDTVTVIDNLSNSSQESLRRVESITGKPIEFIEADLNDHKTLTSVFDNHNFDAVIHFAGLKAVSESTTHALRYYRNNLESTLTLLDVMTNFNTKKLVFSSSATIYGSPDTLPVKEDMPKGATNPYGRTKLMVEQILEDLSATNQDWNITSLRYFNPIGAHETGLIGEDPKGTPNNLLPYITQVASGKLPQLRIFGKNYDTRDGTGTRDYIDIIDLAKAHLAALKNIEHPNVYKAYNIGTGTDTSVLELINAFETASDKKIPYEFVERRTGDIASCYADPSLANRELGWSAQVSLIDSCRNAWKWQSQNPNGYEK